MYIFYGLNVLLKYIQGAFCLFNCLQVLHSVFIILRPLAYDISSFEIWVINYFSYP